MPSINFTHNIDITPDRFIGACSLTELYELEILLHKKLNKIEQEMEVTDLDRASAKHKIELALKQKQNGSDKDNKD